MTSRWVLPRGTAGSDEWDVVVGPTLEGWTYTGLYAGRLGTGDRRTVDIGAREAIVVPLSGSVRVTCTDAAGLTHTADLAGRSSVFAGPADVAYVPRASTLVLEADGDCRVALAVAALPQTAPAVPVPFRHLPAADVPTELRGAGRMSREVRNFGTPGVLDAERLIACEVVTPAGNWSSYPPHKHDEHRAGVESELEEIYYVEVRPESGSPATRDADPIGYLRVYGAGDREIDVLAEVRSGDVVLVPFGWHGPAMAVPGYDLYYLNVMAGPVHDGAERAWLICDDPAHGWVRETWASQDVDTRLPIGGTP